MEIKFFNTETRAMEVFTPIIPEKVNLYTCGPTVYNFAHIGNIRTFVFEDLLRRFLKYAGYGVTQVMNITDIDDKILRDYPESGLGFKGFTDKYTQLFFADLETLNVEKAEHYPRATDHVQEMIEIISRLIERGHAYKADDNCVYFRIASFPEYGRLAHIDLSELRQGVRVKLDEYSKDNAQDFALWKAWEEADGDVTWDSPWGRGRPGWHIECSAMSTKYLGNHFDIHTGGVDNIFPHHENEIAQTECATGETFVNYWLHSEHLIVEGKKMSKSLGNFYTLRDLLEQGYEPLAVRYLLVSTHYRQQLNFTMEGLRAAATCVQRLADFRQRLEEAVASERSGTNPEVASLVTSMQQRFDLALADDLNVSPALAAIFEMMNEINRREADTPLSSADAQSVLDALTRMDTVLAVFPAADAEIPAAVTSLAEQRREARVTKNWSRADELRAEITAAGWVMEDTRDGYRLKKA